MISTVMAQQLLSPEQIQQVLSVASQLPRGYTLTGAADWKMLEFMIGILFVFISAMWVDMRTNLKATKQDWKVAITACELANKNEHEKIWSAITDCQHECCPRGVKL